MCTSAEYPREEGERVYCVGGGTASEGSGKTREVWREVRHWQWELGRKGAIRDGGRKGCRPWAFVKAGSGSEGEVRLDFQVPMPGALVMTPVRHGMRSRSRSGGSEESSQ